LTRAISVLVALGVVVGADRASPSISANPRDLPSLLRRWTWKGPVEDAVLAEGVVYVRGQGRVTALVADNGRVLWETVCARGKDLWGCGPLVEGDRVVVSFPGRLLLLDRHSGRVVKALELGAVHDIVAPPLVVVATGKRDRVDLVRVDPDFGEILARREVGGIVYDAKTAGSLVVALVDRAARDALGSEETIVAYRTDDLTEVWRWPFDGFPDLEWIQGSLYAAALEGMGHDARGVYRRIDTETGRLGAALPPRLESRISGGLTWELEIVDLREGSHPARLRRNSVETGRPVWTADLPGNVRGWVRDRDVLYLHCDHEGGRGYFLVLDWATGAVRQAAYGLREVRGLFSVGDAVIAWQKEGLAAFAARSFGPPEGRSRDLRREVEEILRGVADGDVPLDRQEHVQAAVTDLKTLGSRALPIVAGEVPRLGAPALLAAARVLGDARFRAAAPLLAARLPEPPPPPRADWDQWDPAFEVLIALSRIGGDQQVGPVSTVLTDPTRDGATRRQALATLASIGTPAAVQVIETVLSRATAPEPWWRAPTPHDFADLIGRPDLAALEEQARERGEWDEMGRIGRARGGVRVPLPDGGALLLFHDARIGGHRDLWVATVDREGRVSSGRFVGGSVQGVIDASLAGGTLIVERTSPPGSVRIELSDLGKDSDRDGLPDRVEARFRTDPLRSDTDGDGMPDSVDPAPNGAGVPRTEDEEIVHSIFQQFFMFENAAEGLPEAAIVVSDSPLQWVGRRGPTFTLDAAQDAQLLEEAGLDGIAHIFIEPGRQQLGREGGEEEDPLLPPDERWYQLTIYRGGLDAVGYDIRVRKLERLWVIEECSFAWVS
jgi:hypothetical protein